MEWKVTSILIIIIQLAVNKGQSAEALPPEQKEIDKTSMILCHSDQTFFCLNASHYSPCVHLNISNLKDTSLPASQNNEIYCGENRCCQPGAPSPCTHCPRLGFQSPHILWNVAHHGGRRMEQVSARTSDVDRLNQIISVKSFVVRQKDLENWGYFDSANELEEWKPSYRTYCPLLSEDIPTKNPKQTTTGPKSTVTMTKSTTLTTQKRKSTEHSSTKLRTTQATTKRRTTRAITTKPTRTKRTTTKHTTTKTHTTKHTTTKHTTTKPHTTKHTTTKHTTTKHTTTKRTTRRTTTTRTTPSKLHKRTTPSHKLSGNIPCTALLIHRKLSISGTCEDYLECTKRKKKHGQTVYKWRIRSCPPHKYFSVYYQQCQKMEKVNCVIGTDRKKKISQKVFNT